MEDINKAMIVSKVDAYRCPNCGKMFLTASRCPECGQRVETLAEHQSRIKERVEMVRAMETVCRNINDEEVFMGWLMCGVADEDITPDTTDEFIAEQYCEDEGGFAELMDTFLRCMLRANKSGGLFCGDVVSTIGNEEE